MAILLLPTTLIRRVRRRLASATAFPTSPFTGGQQVQDWGGRWWEYEMEFAVSQGRDARALSVTLDALAGGANTFLFRDPTIAGAQVYQGPILVNGAGQTGQTLVTDGWTGTGLLAGDFFDLAYSGGETIRLHRLTADATPVSGSCTLQFIPPLRSSPPDNNAIGTFSPRVVLRPQGVIPTDIGRVDKHQFTLSAREAI